MTKERPEHGELTPEDARFVGRVAELYRAPEASGAERSAFLAQLDARIARDRRRHPGRGWVGALAAAGLALFVFFALPAAPPSVPGGPTTAGALPAAEAILALASEPAENDAEALPDDYLAIESLFLGASI